LRPTQENVGTTWRDQSSRTTRIAGKATSSESHCAGAHRDRQQILGWGGRTLLPPALDVCSRSYQHLAALSRMDSKDSDFEDPAISDLRVNSRRLECLVWVKLSQSSRFPMSPVYSPKRASF
jgi:hypothetical protein